VKSYKVLVLDLLGQNYEDHGYRFPDYDYAVQYAQGQAYCHPLFLLLQDITKVEESDDLPNVEDWPKY
jgi:hypothetical protein